MRAGAPHRVVPHLEEGRARAQHDAAQQVLPVQAGAHGGRGRLAGAVGVALGVGVLAHGEGLGVAGVVGGVRVEAALAAGALALAVALVVGPAEVLRLAVVAVVAAA